MQTLKTPKRRNSLNMAKEKGNEGEGRDFEELVKASQPKFLETVKETYYLAVLGSLCIAISSFTYQQNYAQAQAYAIAGASLFLTAFVCTFITRILPSALLISLSYLSTALGVLMLFLVTVQFYYSSVMVSKVLYLVLVGVMAIAIAGIPFNIYHVRKKARGKFRTVSTVSLISFSIFAIGFPITYIMPRFYSLSSTTTANFFIILFLVLVGAGVVGIPTVIATWVFSYKENKLKKEAKTTANVTPSHDEIRFSILTILYKKAETSPKDSTVSWEKLKELLNIEDNKIDFNLDYLEQKELITRPQLFHGSYKLTAKITASGMDVIEHKEENKSRFPFLNATIPIKIQTKIGLINL